MPSFFPFQQGMEPSSQANESEPLLGRFRAVPAKRRSRGESINKLFGAGYSSLFGALTGLGDDQTEEAVTEDESTWTSFRKDVNDLWIHPQQGAVRRCCDKWWSRWGVLVVLPAAIAVAWCAMPFPQYPFDDDEGGDDGDYDVVDGLRGHKFSGHGQARVYVNFWFFLFAYYGIYNIVGLMWVTKVFNIYSLNWWPKMLGFPLTISIIAVTSIALPIPAYFVPELKPYLQHNTTWIVWTFITMAMPVIVAFGILMSHERHIGLRQSLSETQRIFTTSWWTGENNDDTISRRERRGRTPLSLSSFEENTNVFREPEPQVRGPVQEAIRLRKLWIPASFMRFMWFCLALFIGLAAYVLGETYAEIYLRTLPHNNIETLLYVWSWVATVHLLDALTGFILGGGEGERVGSYPLGWIFKLYFSLTYQTYVRALYARLRSPRTFIYLQILSSTGMIVLHPLTMSSTYHSILNLIGLNNQPYPLYQKYCGRSIFLRSLAENVSMLSFLGQVAVLHFGHNKNVYPYFAFDDTDPSSGGGSTSPSPWWPGIPGSGGSDGNGGGQQVYDFGLTFWASSITWVCELSAAWIVRRIVGKMYKFNVNLEGRNDIGAWPELLPTGVIVMVHVLQNMIFGIVRLGFE